MSKPDQVPAWPADEPTWRKYNSATDYPILLAAYQKNPEVSIVIAARALEAAGIVWPNLQHSTPEASAVNRDILRAWGEVGLHPRRE